jgi:hypothetical protein
VQELRQTQTLVAFYEMEEDCQFDFLDASDYVLLKTKEEELVSPLPSSALQSSVILMDKPKEEVKRLSPQLKHG